MQRFRKLFTRNPKPLVIPTTQRHVLIISAFVKDGVVSVSWNGKHKKGKFDDKTLRDMVYGINFQDNYFQMMGVVAQLIQSLTKKS